ncbi:hypothetical protein [Streptomyces adelaidensis]|uniref:hypothetical protein n=1 Tax=Streptomyces adelaidensis TaxID=2796465 RepID=UPI001905524D|nr:hypothetical protein [Streptomyces adelaidensis]
MSEEPACPDDELAVNPVMATFSELLDHAVVCVDACRRKGVSCLQGMRLTKKHRAARKVAGAARMKQRERERERERERQGQGQGQGQDGSD